MRVKWLRTSVARLTLKYTVLYGVVLGVMHLALYWSSSRYVDAQLKEDLRLELYALSSVVERSGGDALARLLEAMKARAAGEGNYYLLATNNGIPIAGNLTKWPHEADDLPLGAVRNIWLDDDIMVGNFYQNDAYLPAAVNVLPNGTRLLLARGVEQDHILRELSENLFESMGAVVFFALLMGIMLGRVVLKRLDAISMTAGEIMSGDLSRRIPVSSRNDEFDALSRRLNAMLQRIEEVLQGMREVTDSVAHDLRSPVTRMRNRMEITLLADHHDENTYRQVLEQCIKDAEIMMRTFNAVMQTAQATAGTIRAELVPLDLQKLVRELGELYLPVAEEADLSLEVAETEKATVVGNADKLAQAIGNLLENAVKYTPAGGRITLSVSSRRDFVEICVADTGPGIPEKDYERVKQRFVRLDSARHTGGSGLGLSFVDAIARLHGADLVFADNHPGLRASIRFPVVRDRGFRGRGG